MGHVGGLMFGLLTDNVLRTGCQAWTPRICLPPLSGMGCRRVGLERYDELKGLDWSWLSMDGAMTKSPLGGGKNRPQRGSP